MENQKSNVLYIRNYLNKKNNRISTPWTRSMKVKIKNIDTQKDQTNKQTT